MTSAPGTLRPVDPDTEAARLAQARARQRFTLTFTKRELAFLIDAVMVLAHQMANIPENDGSELPELKALQHRLEAA